MYQKSIRFLLIMVVLGGFFSCKSSDLVPTVDLTTPYYPPLTGSEWQTADPATLGWNVTKLNSTIDWVGANQSTAFIILYKGRIVTEKYWNGWNASTAQPIFSATKSMTAFLTGIAQQQGKLTIDQRVSDILGKGWSKATEAKENLITVKHLLAMTSGLDDNLMYTADAGTKWYYNTNAYYQVIDVLEKVTGKTINDYTKEQLFDKIGMSSSVWRTGLLSTNISANGRDMARYGLLIASDGTWNGTSLFNTQTYLQQMLGSSQTLNPSYGYLWWLNGKSGYVLPSSTPQLAVLVAGSLIPDAPADLLSALGKGDKKIYVLKSRDLVVIRHGEQVGDSSQALSSFDNDLWKRLMEAMPTK